MRSRQAIGSPHPPHPEVVWWEFCFLAGRQMQRVAFRSLLPREHAGLSRALSDAIAAHVRRDGNVPHGMGFLAISTQPRQSMGRARDLLDTISTATCQDMEDMDVEDRSLWQSLLRKADEIDEVSEGAAQASGMRVEFVWDAGGADDNPFSDGFDCVLATARGRSLVEAFCGELERWGDRQGHWYDFWSAAEQEACVDPQMHRMTVEELEAWREENEELLTPALVSMLDLVARHDQQVALSQSLPPAPASGAPPRPRI